MKGIAKIAAFAAAAAFLAGTALSVSVKTAKADDGEYVHYVLEDDFSEYNQGNWSLYQQPYLTGGEDPVTADPISFSGGISISGDFADVR